MTASGVDGRPCPASNLARHHRLEHDLLDAERTLPGACRPSSG
jgi:hypothetical protein